MLACFQHILYAHGPWFVKQYGPLARWNTQGMEKSHYKVKVVYFKNSRHGGEITQSNALHGMFDWFYRCLCEREQKSIKEKESTIGKAMKVVSTEQKEKFGGPLLHQISTRHGCKH